MNCFLLSKCIVFFDACSSFCLECSFPILVAGCFISFYVYAQTSFPKWNFPKVPHGMYSPPPHFIILIPLLCFLFFMILPEITLLTYYLVYLSVNLLYYIIKEISMRKLAYFKFPCPRIPTLHKGRQQIPICNTCTDVALNLEIAK